MLEHTPSPEEQAQISHTIEMFEVITRTQPDDYQSLETLKVAYQKLGKTDDQVRTSRRLAEAYYNGGSFALAMQECEAVLAAEPGATLPRAMRMTLQRIRTSAEARREANARKSAPSTDGPNKSSG